MRRIVLYGRSVGRSHARSFVTRSTYSGQGPTPQALLPLSFSPLLPLLPLARSYRPTFLTTRHCVPPRWNPVYSFTLWIFRKRFAASRARCASSPRRALFPRLRHQTFHDRSRTARIVRKMSLKALKASPAAPSRRLDVFVGFSNALSSP